MKAAELRIGNYYDDNGVVQTVTANTILEVWEAERAWCKPIPLTEEWFKKLGGSFRFAKEFICDWQNGFVTIEEYGEGEFALKHIKYVHQLQNLYFALTGEELKPIV